MLPPPPPPRATGEYNLNLHQEGHGQAAVPGISALTMISVKAKRLVRSLRTVVTHQGEAAPVLHTRLHPLHLTTRTNTSSLSLKITSIAARPR